MLLNAIATLTNTVGTLSVSGQKDAAEKVTAKILELVKKIE